MDTKRVLAYVVERLQESSTWRGIVLIATAFGAKLDPARWEAIVTLGLMVAGVVAVAFPDRKRPPAPVEPPHDDGTADGSS